MNCQNTKCWSDRILTIMAHAKDCHVYEINGEEYNGYAQVLCRSDDDTEIVVCLECGQIQGEFPLPPMFMEPDFEEES